MFRHWLDIGWHADMAYMAANLDKRLDPTKLVDGANSVICLVASYPSQTELVFNPQSASSSPAGAGNPQSDAAGIARFATGPDYHKVLKKRCIHLMDSIRRIAPGFAGRAFCDSAPVMERTLSATAGLGWIGRNGCLIVPGLGSYVVLAEIICNLPLVSDRPIAPQCGDCRQCISACPTGALQEPGATAASSAAVPGAMPPPLRGADMSPGNDRPTSSVSLIDCRKCISYLTIEHDGDIPPDLRPAMGQSIFGCDRCQQVCPHNSVADVPSARQPGVSPAQILRWTPHDWDLATCGSTIRRAGYHMLLRNAIIAAGNSGDQALIEPLQNLAQREPQLNDLSQWAIELLRNEPEA
jgi:epoxyqueuosine reductase